MRSRSLFTALIVALAAFPSFAQKKQPQRQKTPDKVVQDAKKIVKVDINRATAKQIEKAALGIEAKTAAAIVAWRKKNGAFKTTDDLLEVTGVRATMVLKNVKVFGLRYGKKNVKALAAKEEARAKKAKGNIKPASGKKKSQKRDPKAEKPKGKGTKKKSGTKKHG